MLVARRTLKPRGSDDWGSGDYGASRGSRTHRGIDLITEPGDEILSPVKGRVSKIGFPYAPKKGDKILYKYVQVTDYKGGKHRIFYIEPTVAVDRHVDTNTVIGLAQDIASKYSTPERVMICHCHLEIISADGDYINPEDYA